MNFSYINFSMLKYILFGPIYLGNVAKYDAHFFYQMYLLRRPMNLVFKFIWMIYYIYQNVYISYLHHWDSNNLIMVDGLFYICLRSFASMFISDSDLLFSFCVCSPGFSVRVL